MADYGQFAANMTPSTKPEAYNALERRHRRTEPLGSETELDLVRSDETMRWDGMGWAM